MKSAVFDRNDCLLLGIDMQEKLMGVMVYEKEIIKNANTLLKAANAFKLQTFICEQYPKGLGNTHFEIKLDESKNAPHFTLFEKISFSVFNDENMAKAIQQSGKKTLIIFGIETHVCVLQSVIMALNLGFEVWLLEDILSSRTKQNHKNALKLMQSLGAKITNLESFLFGLMIEAKGDEFKLISSLVK